MRCGDHDSDSLTVEPAATKTGEHTYAKENRVQNIGPNNTQLGWLSDHPVEAYLVLKPAVPYWNRVLGLGCLSASSVRRSREKEDMVV